jgi:hypothetical protein
LLCDTSKIIGRENFMKRPVTLTFALGLLTLLVLLGSLLPMVSGQRFAGVSQQNIVSNPSQGILQSGEKPEDQSPARGPQNGTPPFNENLQGPNQSRTLEYVLYSLILALGLIAFNGLWRWKFWGNVVSIITASIVIVPTLPMIFKNVPTLVLIECLIKVILAAGVIVLVLVPASRQGRVKLITN